MNPLTTAGTGVTLIRMGIVIVSIILLIVLIAVPDSRQIAGALLLASAAAYGATYLFSGATAKFAPRHGYSQPPPAPPRSASKPPKQGKGDNTVGEHDGAYEADYPW